MKEVISLKVEVLKVIGDLEIIAWQARNMIHCVSPNLINYKQEVWHLISQLKDFNIIYVPHIHNVVVDTLANVVANTLENVSTRLSPLRDGFLVEIIYKASIPDNMTNFHVF